MKRLIYTLAITMFMATTIGCGSPKNSNPIDDMPVTLNGSPSNGSATGTSASTPPVSTPVQSGGLKVTLDWGTVGAVGTAKPSSVSTIRYTVSGAGITTPIQKTFTANNDSTLLNEMDSIPSGSNRTLVVEGIDGSGVVIYSGTEAGLTIIPGVIGNCGTVNLSPGTAGSSTTGTTGTTGSGTTGGSTGTGTTGTGTSGGGSTGTVAPASGAPYSVTVLSTPTTMGHGGSYYPAPIKVKVLDKNSNPVSGIVPTVSFNDNGWVMNPTTTTNSAGEASYYWAPGSNKYPSMIVSYGGASSTAVTAMIEQWRTNPNANAAGMSNATPAAIGYSKQIKPLADPTGTYYAVLQWQGGYAGIQRGGARYDRQLQFSLWDIAGAAKASVVNSGSSVCGPFGGEGNGIKCENTYPWVVGGTYQMSMVATAGSGYTDITVQFKDVSNGTTVNMGTIRQPNGPTSFTSVTSFVEDFIVNNPTCFTIPDRSAEFTNAQYLVGSTWSNVTGSTTISRWDPTAYCAQSSHTAVTGGAQINVGKSFRTPTLATFSVL
jgi:hypothetical protein